MLRKRHPFVVLTLEFPPPMLCPESVVLCSLTVRYVGFYFSSRSNCGVIGVGSIPLGFNGNSCL